MPALLSNAFGRSRTQSVHEIRVRALFEGRLRGGPVPTVSDVETVFILFTNRSGSNFLATALKESGFFNKAGEDLNWQTIANQTERYRYRTLYEYLVSRLDKSIDGRFAIKASLQQYDFLAREGLLNDVFPKRRVLATLRYDYVAQAVSWIIASQTGQWTSGHPRTNVDEITYDREKIARAARSFARGQRDIVAYLNLRPEPACFVPYEDLVSDFDLTLARVGRFLGCSGFSVDPTSVSIRRQSTALNAALRDRFINESLAQLETDH